MPYKEKEIEKLYYTIGEVALMFGVNTSHIRFWSNEFDVIRPATNKKGNRLYTQDDIENFRKIYHLVKEKGFTLRGAKTELREMKTRLRQEPSSVQVDEMDVPELDELQLPMQAADHAPVDSAAAIPVTGKLFSEDYVDRLAVRNSLEKIKAVLLEIRKDLQHIPGA